MPRSEINRIIAQKRHFYLREVLPSQAGKLETAPTTPQLHYLPANFFDHFRLVDEVDDVFFELKRQLPKLVQQTIWDRVVDYWIALDLETWWVKVATPEFIEGLNYLVHDVVDRLIDYSRTISLLTDLEMVAENIETPGYQKLAAKKAKFRSSTFYPYYWNGELDMIDQLFRQKNIKK